MKYMITIVPSGNGEEAFTFSQFPELKGSGRTAEDALSLAGRLVDVHRSTIRLSFASSEWHNSEASLHDATDCSSAHACLALKLKRLRGPWSQQVLAELAGMKQQAYQRLEKPQLCNPTVKTLERLATAFGRNLVIDFR